jgi:hypothetical protein
MLEKVGCRQAELPPGRPALRRLKALNSVTKKMHAGR